MWLPKPQQLMLCHPEPFDFAQGRLREGAKHWAWHQLIGARRLFGPFAALRVTPAIALALCAACASPEDHRRPGQPGADVRNWGSPVEFHAGAQPFHDTPCVTEKVECQGPPPVFGSTPSPD
jgi:hypothetical protein